MNLIEHLLDAQNEIGESPIWHIKEQALYWADIENAEVHRFDSTSKKHQIYHVDMPVTALCLRDSGGWVTATKAGLAFFDEAFQNKKFIVDPVAEESNIRFNDAVVDRSGRLWAGTLNEADLDAPDGGLFRLDRDRTIRQFDSGFAVANGITTSPDGSILYVSDMSHRRVLAYDLDSENGTISKRRVFVEVAEDDLNQAADFLENFRTHWERLDGDEEGRHELVKLIVERVYVKDSQVVAMTLRSNYHLVLNHKTNEPTDFSVDSSPYTCGSDGYRSLTCITFLPKHIAHKLLYSSQVTREKLDLIDRSVSVRL